MARGLLRARAMENSLFVSHLPLLVQHHEPMIRVLRARDSAPYPSEVVSLLDKHFDRTKIARAASVARAEANRTAELLLKLGVRAVDFWSPYFPANLRVIKYPPWVLYFRGELPRPQTTLGVVGTRNPNSYGAELVAKFIPALQTRPLQLVSGLALGIDGLSHYWACECRIPNFAVLGCGVDRIYPRAHAQLAERIIESGGGIISELAPGTAALAGHFPLRNRIISGLSDVLWVVQGALKSGSYITAKHALEQNKEIAACPADIYAELSAIPNWLIKDGAHTILHAEDLDLLLNSTRATIAY